jgi:hypothetical protein
MPSGPLTARRGQLARAAADRAGLQPALEAGVGAQRNAVGVEARVEPAVSRRAKRAEVGDDVVARVGRALGLAGADVGGPQRGDVGRRGRCRCGRRGGGRGGRRRGGADRFAGSGRRRARGREPEAAESGEDASMRLGSGHERLLFCRNWQRNERYCS